MLSCHWLPLLCIKSRSGKFNQINCAHILGESQTPDSLDHTGTISGLFSCFFFPASVCLWYSLQRKLLLTAVIKTMKERRNTQPMVVRCKLVLVGDVQCGKTAMLQVLAKDCYPEVCCMLMFVKRIYLLTDAHTSVMCFAGDQGVSLYILTECGRGQKSVRLLQTAQFACAFSRFCVFGLF